MSRQNSLQKAVAKLEYPTRREVNELKKRVRDLEKRFEIYVIPDAINVNGWASRFKHLKDDVAKIKEYLEGSWNTTVTGDIKIVPIVPSAPAPSFIVKLLRKLK